MRLVLLAVIAGLLAGGAAFAGPDLTKVHTFDPRRLPRSPTQAFDPHIDPRRLKLPPEITGSLLFYDFKSTKLGAYTPPPVSVGQTTQGIEPNYTTLTVVPAANGLKTRSLKIAPGDSAYYVGPYFDTPPVDLAQRRNVVAEWTGYLPSGTHIEFHLFTNHFQDIAGAAAFSGTVSTIDGGGTVKFGTFQHGKTVNGTLVALPETIRIEADLVAKTFVVKLVQDGTTVASPPRPFPYAAPAGPTYLYLWIMFPNGKEKPTYQLARIAISALPK